jgi:hypothetical protein
VSKPCLAFPLQCQTASKVALNISDNEAANRMMQARQKLFNDIHEQIRKTG